MSSRYDLRFKSLREQKQKAFIPFTVLGYTDRQSSLQTARQMIECGASALELGIAFSDPIADGPVLQTAAHETLRSGFSLEQAFGLLRDIRAYDQDIPIGILVYYNMVLAAGADNFFASAKESGVDGVLIADLPIESAEEVLPAAKKYQIDPIFLVSPLTGEERLDRILSHASGFIYLVSRLGVTGTLPRSIEKDRELSGLITAIRKRTDLPICAGFGISSPQNAATFLSLGIDGVITASRIVELIQKEGFPTKVLPSFYANMIQACAAYTA